MDQLHCHVALHEVKHVHHDLVRVLIVQDANSLIFQLEVALTQTSVVVHGVASTGPFTGLFQHFSHRLAEAVTDICEAIVFSKRTSPLYVQNPGFHRKAWNVILEILAAVICHLCLLVEHVSTFKLFVIVLESDSVMVIGLFGKSS